MTSKIVLEKKIAEKQEKINAKSQMPYSD